jgi:acyl transferase domain-containing protein
MNNSIGIEKDIAIVGMSSLFANTRNLDEYWQSIVDEINCITEVPENRWKITDYYIWRKPGLHTSMMFLIWTKRISILIQWF